MSLLFFSINAVQTFHYVYGNMTSPIWAWLVESPYN